MRQVLPCAPALAILIGCSGGTNPDPDPGDLDAGSAPDGQVADGPSSSRLTAQPAGDNTSGRGFYEYLPPDYSASETYPLLVFLHGIGENGNGTTQLSRVLAGGPPRLIADDQWPADRPFVVLSPQQSGGGCPDADDIQAFIAWAIDNYPIDPDRVYLTGLSCGAIGSWDYLGRYLGSQIAALVAIAGTGFQAWNSQGCALGEVAVWGFHGDADAVVNVQGTLVPMNGLLDCPSPPRRDARLTIYPDVGHDSWTRTYDLSAGHDIYAWFLTHTR